MRAGLLADTIIDGCPPVWTPVPDWGPVTKRVPSIAVDDRLTIYAGRTAIESTIPATPPTPRRPRRLAPGAHVRLFTRTRCPALFMGSVSGARRSLEWLASFEPAVIVPGHGPLAAEAAIADVLDAHDRYYRFVESVAADGLATGSALEAARLRPRRVRRVGRRRAARAQPPPRLRRRGGPRDRPVRRDDRRHRVQRRTTLRAHPACAARLS